MQWATCITSPESEGRREGRHPFRAALREGAASMAQRPPGLPAGPGCSAYTRPVCQAPQARPTHRAGTAPAPPSAARGASPALGEGRGGLGWTLADCTPLEAALHSLQTSAGQWMEAPPPPLPHLCAVDGNHYVAASLLRHCSCDAVVWCCAGCCQQPCLPGRRAEGSGGAGGGAAGEARRSNGLRRSSRYAMLLVDGANTRVERSKAHGAPQGGAPQSVGRAVRALFPVQTFLGMSGRV